MRKLAILLSFLFIYNFVFATQNAQVTPTQTSQEQEVSPKVPIVQFRMFLDFNINPFYWEISRNLGGFGMNPSAMFGAVWQEKTFGVQADMNYHSLASLETDDSKKVDGAFSIFRFTAVSYIPLTKFMEIKVSAGGAFMSTAVRYKADRNIQQPHNQSYCRFRTEFLQYSQLLYMPHHCPKKVTFPSAGHTE
jgi:hypothetical protein